MSAPADDGAAEFDVTDSLMLMLEQAQPDAVQAIVHRVEFFLRDLRRVKDENPLSLAYSVHCEVDEAIERHRKAKPDSKAITCRRGCAHCCRMMVDIWPAEAALLLFAAAEAGIEVDVGRLERQAASPTIEQWRQLPAGDRDCVFLGVDGSCRVYEHRPNACRKLLVASDPDKCDAVKSPGAIVKRWVTLDAEMIESAAITAFGSGLMPALLLKAISDR